MTLYISCEKDMKNNILMPYMHEVTRQILVVRIRLDNFIILRRSQDHLAGNEPIFQANIDMVCPKDSAARTHFRINSSGSESNVLLPAIPQPLQVGPDRLVELCGFG